MSQDDIAVAAMFTAIISLCGLISTFQDPVNHRLGRFLVRGVFLTWTVCAVFYVIRAAI